MGVPQGAGIVSDEHDEPSGGIEISRAKSRRPQYRTFTDKVAK